MNFLIFLFLNLSKVYALETEVGTVPGSEHALANFIDNIYDIILPVGMAIAVAMIVYAGIKYTTSSGNPDKIAEAKEIFVSTLVGVIVLLLAGLILSLINPNM